MRPWRHRAYPTKPSPSPLLAGLFLAGAIRRGDRVLDVGCGTGTDALGLAAWGVRDVTGIDVSSRAIGIARRRARARRLPVRFDVCDVVDVPGRFPRGAFDLAIDSLLWNNLDSKQRRGYARALAWAVAPRGRLLVQCRVTRHEFDARLRRPLGPALARAFDLRGPVHVHLPEDAPPAARVAAYLGMRQRGPGTKARRWASRA